jgi:CRISPR/Cas system CSM-associated protein Csm2 small subunit
MFGQYKTLRKLIQKVTDDSEKVRALMQLKIIAKSIIPPQIKYEKVEVIEPSIGGGSMEGQ